MRRKISLYIADRMVDLDDQSLILLNYTMEDLNNPTIVRNSYSQQVTLKGTPNNDDLFGHIYHLDRVVTYNGGNAGTDFNPSQRTPFTIYNELGEILESGYCKLDSITKEKGGVEYHITLFGGLGSFLYSLAYDAEGNKRTLADLEYLETPNAETELDFTINAESVASAWATDPAEGAVDNIWKVINFAPAYNGIPEGKFSPDKALVVPSQVGLQDTKDGYTLRNGYALVNLSQAHDEWDIKDLRSYLQRPVFSMRAFLEAIKKAGNNGGYVVNMPFLEKARFGWYGKNLWMTLPLIPSLGVNEQRSGDLSLTMSSSFTSNHVIGRFNIVGDVPFGTSVNTSVNIRLEYYLPGVTDLSLSRSASVTAGRNTSGKQSVIFMQLVAHAEDDSIVGGSKVKSIYNWRWMSASQMAERCGYVPPFTNGDDTYESTPIKTETFYKQGNNFIFADDLGFTCEAKDVAYYEMHVTTYDIRTLVTTGGTSGGSNPEITSVIGGGNSLAVLRKDYDTAFTPTYGRMIQALFDNTITYASAESLRSGAHITKAMLLSTSQTPADYLLSYCKIFGLHILFDKSTNEISILDREDLFQNETIDLTKRVDISKGIGVNPFVFDSKWYEFKQESVGGAFLDEYKSLHGKEYGIQRINTGYDFNAETINFMEGNAFKNGATILGRSGYFTKIKVQGQLRPSVFMDQGNTYTLWDASGNTLDTPIPIPPFVASVEYYNENNHPGFDIELARKMEFRSKDNKPIDGAGVLVFLEGRNNYEYFQLTDDVAAMDVLNDGVPCWLLNPGTEDGVTIPIFGRYTFQNDWTIKDSLDFGVPAEVDIPSITYPSGATIYSRMWKNYLADRFDVNTKVMRCWVDFNGMQVGHQLLRKFYWFDNSIWVLNAIKNYSLTTYDMVECEFVQVKDKDNYLNGQS